MTGRYKAYPEYMTADSKWLDEIPAHWKVAALKHVLSTPITDGPHSTPIFQDEGIPFVSAEAVSGGYINFDKIRGYISEEDDALFSQKYRPQLHDVYMIKSGATTGISAIVETNRRFNIWSPLAVMRCKKSYDPYFLLNYLRSDSFQKSVQLSWTFGTQQNIGMNTLENLTVCFPPFEEQQKIANFLNHETTKIDTLIAKQEKLIELLKEKRQAVISHAVTKGLNPDAPMKDSGVEWLGDVPEHWDVTKFSYAIDFLEGPGILAADFHDEGVPLLRIQNVKEVFVTDNFKTYLDPLKVKEKWDHFRVEKGDLLISASASTGLISEVDERTVGAVPYTGLIRLKPMTQDITAGFIRYIVQSDLFYEQIKLLQTGSTIQHFGPIHLQQMKVILPPVDEQDKIVDQIQQSVKHIDSLIESAYRIIDLTKERKTALISAAVTGKIDVRDWQEPTYQESAQR
ncbi:restriction endonuclease subunit S [Vibrio parahaemolyticus]|uniref:restriction endonuclease subunit S n=1 Tax=Vibrio parahaemolyticus TaxID=670 RepID=UPI001EEB5B4B|nr:restriction endonuclease subunit S [Vibrio parahaemolyticus]MCG6432073.1 restriction endonuclease subunit S [Vibrio parahaemolyticus]